MNYVAICSSSQRCIGPKIRVGSRHPRGRRDGAYSVVAPQGRGFSRRGQREKGGGGKGPVGSGLREALHDCLSALHGKNGLSY